ncbi:MAG: acetoin reductase [Streptococcaceae bacterium]|jgi:meso-butanediol dehydrogenase/(S,S)-butanediol dehydrogenase/diacetyl reductase|nr:acetoin reductase [Streptococcaceae bacterium]
MSKVAVVTGAGRGIGKGIASQLAHDGYAVVVADFDEVNANQTAKELVEQGFQAVAALGDVSRESAHKEFIKVAVDNFGRLDTYVNNAGIAQVETVANITKEHLEQIFGINVYGALFGIQAAREQFLKQDDGDKIRKIINASSIAGHQAFDMLAAYSATKFAVRAFTQASAKEFAKDHITVNSYCPGIVLTPMWDLIDSEMVKLNGGEIGSYLKKYSEAIALGRGETPTDVANFVSYLASEKSDYMTGQSVQIDGGIQFI